MKTKIAIIGSIATAIVAGSIMAASAQTSGLTVACSGVVSSSQITWSATTTGGVAPVTLLWSGDSSVSGQTSSLFVKSYAATGTIQATVQATDASSTMATSTCSATILPPPPAPTPAPTSTPHLPRVNPPSLSITPGGAFLARGMTVTSVASGSFQAQVWGITYTVNWSGSFPRFYLRGGNGATSTTNPADQLSVGDEVGVSGRITSSSPFVVTADVVRDYNLVMVRPARHGGGDGDKDDKGNGIGFGEIRNATDAVVTSATDISRHVGDLMNQLKGLQDLFKNRFGGGGNGKGNGGSH
ncbi:MAG TPA: hypothetical protein VMT99_01280 [Candidatus Paceibacterota bacterium]|nr:hypothetical protein [Candidatus Paceibacterota bacterium]